MKSKTFYRRNLPHINPIEGTYFVTFCLADTISQPEIRQLIQKHEMNLNQLRRNPKVSSNQIDLENRKYFKKLDEAIHVAKGKHYLKDDRISQAVAEALHFWQEKKIDLMSYCIMSNHVHIVLRLLEHEPEVFLRDVLESIKKFSAKKANHILRRKGQFWQHESFDRLVRDREELHRIISYVLDNPTKARLCENREDWKWNYVKAEYNEFM